MSPTSFVGHDAAHGLAEGGTVHGDIAEHAPRAGLDETRRVQAEQRVAGHLQQMRQQAFVYLAGNPLAIVGQILRLDTGCRERTVDIQTELFGLAQVFEQGGNRGIAEVFHGFFLFCDACLDWR